MILLIEHTQTQIDKDNIRENRHIFDHDYKVRDNVMLTKHTAYKYDTPYMGPFVITQCFTNVTIKSKCDAKKVRYNIRHIKPYKSDTKVEDSSPINMSDDASI